MNPRKQTLIRSFQFLGLTAATAFIALGVTACKSNQNANQAQIAQQDATGSVDPAAANLAPGTSTTSGQPTQVLGENQSYTPQQSSYSNEPSGGYNSGAYPASGDYAYNNYDADTQDQESQAPPPIPEYDQPASPGPDWYWTPGYWAWGTDGYYWVPGTWVEPPYYGALWTPPYWGYYNNHYLFHRGYWGPHVGFYGGIDYGFGYIGIGYYGGYWRGHDFYYNRSVTNVGSVGNFYNRPVVVNNVHYGAAPINRVSYNGGRGGIAIAPRPAELAARTERHAQPVASQVALRETAAHNPAFAYNTNHGRPQQAAFARPEAAGVNTPRAGEPSNRAGEPSNGARPNEASPGEPAVNNRPGAVNPAENQRNLQLQQHNAELQQHNNEAAQRNTELQQHNNEAAQHNTEVQQRAQIQQRAQAQQREQVQHAPAQRAEPQRAEPQRAEPQRAEPQRAPAPQRAEAPRPAPAQHAAPAPHAEAPHAAAPAPHPAPAGGGHEEHH
jgi:hypothetical protein